MHTWLLNNNNWIELTPLKSEHSHERYRGKTQRLPRFLREYGAKFPVAPVESAPMLTEKSAHKQKQCKLPHVSLIAAFFHIFQQSAHMSHIFFPHKLAFSTAILILFMFLLPISIRFRYLDHPFANRMAPSVCPPDPSGTRWGTVGFR